MNSRFSVTTDLGGRKRLPGPLFAAFGATGFRAADWSLDWPGEDRLLMGDERPVVARNSGHREELLALAVPPFSLSLTAEDKTPWRDSGLRSRG